MVISAAWCGLVGSSERRLIQLNASKGIASIMSCVRLGGGLGGPNEPDKNY